LNGAVSGVAENVTATCCTVAVIESDTPSPVTTMRDVPFAPDTTSACAVLALGVTVATQGVGATAM
jgi:hypothetical protein